jgi:3-methyladenine DNA glycosylase AlkC
MEGMPTRSSRPIARRLSDVSDEVRDLLASGQAETRNWTEWMAADMPALARMVARTTRSKALSVALLTAADEAAGKSILQRLAIFGRAVNSSVKGFDGRVFSEICTHRSDLVRQWGAYAVNDSRRSLKLQERLALTLPFAADRHMSVRECAWMAFRPHLAANLRSALKLLGPVSRSADPNLRRFAVEVSRPRSVWGTHIAELKVDPAIGLAVLDNVYQDESRYVRLAAGNWLNDASKTRPDWVQEVCRRWSKNNNRYTRAIVVRGLRTLVRLDQVDAIADRGRKHMSVANADSTEVGGAKC